VAVDVPLALAVIEHHLRAVGIEPADLCVFAAAQRSSGSGRPPHDLAEPADRDPAAVTWWALRGGPAALGRSSWIQPLASIIRWYTSGPTTGTIWASSRALNRSRRSRRIASSERIQFGQITTPRSRWRRTSWMMRRRQSQTRPGSVTIR
jgi:hypothetical protein